jgi:hypothetical protein
MSRKGLRIGDVFEIPLANGQKVYGQYVYWDRRMGPLVQILDIRTDRDATLEEISNSGPLFPPVITGVFAAVRTGMWSVIGNLPVEGFVYPSFIAPVYDSKTRKVHMWYLWDGKKYRRLGEKLPDRYKRLEQLVVWSPHDVVHRIETGENDLDFRLEL